MSDGVNIKDRVVSLEIAMRLKATGVAQEVSEKAWYWKGVFVEFDDQFDNALRYWEHCDAYTTDELIELLGQNLSALCPSPNGGYVAMAWPWDNMSAEADTPADALGLLLEKVLNQKREVGHKHDHKMATDLHRLGG